MLWKSWQTTDWGTRIVATWFWKENFIGKQPFADVLSLPVFATSAKVSSCNKDSTAHKAYNIFIWIFAKKKSLLTLALKRQKSTGHSDGRTMQASQGRKAGGEGEEWSTEGMLRGRGGGGGCAEGDMRVTEREVLASEREVRPQKAAHPIWNYFYKLTDLSANPDMRRTAPETSVQLCMPGWSRVPAEKMLSGKTLGSELGKQR